jgi:hypothetical protein
MDRASFRVAALAAAASLVIACADAQADPGAAAPELAAPGAGQSPPTDAPPTDAPPIDAPPPEAPAIDAPPPDAPPTDAPAEATTAEEDPLEEGAMGAQEGVEQQLAHEGPSGDASVQQQGPVSPSGPQPTAVTSPGGPGGQGGAPDQSVQTIGALAAGALKPPTGAQSVFRPPAAALSPIEPGPIGRVRAPSGGRPLGSGLERVLDDLERELRHVQAQIDDLQRRLDDGAPAPKGELIRLRSSLERIAPVLLALELRLGAAGRLGPRLRAFQHQVRVRLAGARASAGELIAALRRSGERGHELRVLLRELESFCVLEAEPASNGGAGAASVPPEPGADAAYTQLRPALAASPRHAATVPLQRRAAGRPATRPRDRRGPAPHVPWSSSSGAATASPGGGVSAAGLSLLATLPIALAAPRLRAGLRLAADRPYTVAFLAPLGRPG